MRSGNDFANMGGRQVVHATGFIPFCIVGVVLTDSV